MAVGCHHVEIIQDLVLSGVNNTENEYASFTHDHGSYDLQHIIGLDSYFFILSLTQSCEIDASKFFNP